MIKKVLIKNDVPYYEMSRVKELLIMHIKEYLYSGVLRHPTGQLANSIRGYVVDNYIYIYSDKEYAEAIDQGRRPHIMYYLLGKTVPLRNVGMRRVTMKSIVEGKWRHPGHPGVQYVEHALHQLTKHYPNLEMELQ